MAGDGHNAAQTLSASAAAARLVSASAYAAAVAAVAAVAVDVFAGDALGLKGSVSAPTEAPRETSSLAHSQFPACTASCSAERPSPSGSSTYVRPAQERERARRPVRTEGAVGAASRRTLHPWQTIANRCEACWQPGAQTPQCKQSTGRQARHVERHEHL
eukprot:430392-Pleurochrysis_carterae.AAC.11